MIQTAESTEAASLPKAQPDEGMFLRSFVSRKGPQRHCDHLEKLQPAECNPRERRIESVYVRVFLEAISSSNNIYGYWEVDGQLFEELTWTTIVCCEAFELLVQCPPGKRITLGNLDLEVILVSCLEDANGGAFIQKLTSTSKCWPTGHVDFRWLLRGTLAEAGPRAGLDIEGSNSPFARRSSSVRRLFSPVKQLKLATQSLEKKRAMSLEKLQSPTSPTTPSRLQRWDTARRQSLEPSGGIFKETIPPFYVLKVHILLIWTVQKCRYWGLGYGAHSGTRGVVGTGILVNFADGTHPSQVLAEI